MSEPPAPLSPLSRDHTCLRSMNWRFDLPPAAVDDAIAALLAAGFSPLPSPDFLPSLQCPQGHRVLLVRRTGRAQIRVDHATPEPQRRLAAEGVYASIARALLAG